jgi:hypothetical protein
MQRQMPPPMHKTVRPMVKMATKTNYKRKRR